MRPGIGRILIILIVLGACAVCTKAQLDLPERDINAIKRIKESYRTSWLKGDQEAILGLFADKAKLYPNGLPPVIGKKAIAEFWFAPGNSTTVINEYQVEVDEISGKKTIAVATGSTKIEWTTANKTNGEAKRYRSKGLFMTVFLRQNKKWKIIKHIWNGKFEEIK